eukprot:5063729-Amphidinium_carterae.1
MASTASTVALREDQIEDAICVDVQLAKLPITGYDHGMLARHQQCLREQWVLQQAQEPTRFRPNTAFHQAYQAAMDTGFVSDLQVRSSALCAMGVAHHSPSAFPPRIGCGNCELLYPSSLSECKSHAGRLQTHIFSAIECGLLQ